MTTSLARDAIYFIFPASHRRFTGTGRDLCPGSLTGPLPGSGPLGTGQGPRVRRRLTSPERFELQQLVKSGVLPASALDEARADELEEGKCLHDPAPCSNRDPSLLVRRALT